MDFSLTTENGTPRCRAAHSNASTSYTNVDLTGTYNVTDSWRVGINASNVFNEEVYQAFGGDVLGRRVLAFGQYDW